MGPVTLLNHAGFLAIQAYFKQTDSLGIEYQIKAF